MSSEPVRIASSALTAQINPFGAELWRLQDAQGRDLLWDGDPAFWTGRAPLLFPIIGRLPDDRFTHRGQVYELPKHGLARRREFEVVAAEPDRARFRLVADAQTRAIYPFDFVLEAEFAIESSVLATNVTVANAGDAAMPFTFGFHPAFRWALPDAGSREAHSIAFAEPEAPPLRRLDADGLLGQARLEPPIEGGRLSLRDDLFVEDALIFENVASRSVRLAGEGGVALNVAWNGLPHLGVWTKPGAPYVCIEPWASLPASAEAPRELVERADLIRLAPGGSASFAMTVRIEG